jgi:hypothetical protein
MGVHGRPNASNRRDVADSQAGERQGHFNRHRGCRCSALRAGVTVRGLRSPRPDHDGHRLRRDYRGDRSGDDHDRDGVGHDPDRTGHDDTDHDDDDRHDSDEQLHADRRVVHGYHFVFDVTRAELDARPADVYHFDDVVSDHGPELRVNRVNGVRHKRHD